MKKNKIISLALIFALALGLACVLPSVSAHAASVVCPAGTTSPFCASTTQSVSDIIAVVVKVLLFGIGVAAGIIIIVAAIRLVVSGGDATAVKNAKNSILYAIIGIVLAIAGFAIVDFVVNALTGVPPT